MCTNQYTITTEPIIQTMTDISTWEICSVEAHLHERTRTEVIKEVHDTDTYNLLVHMRFRRNASDDTIRVYNIQELHTGY